MRAIIPGGKRACALEVNQTEPSVRAVRYRVMRALYQVGIVALLRSLHLGGPNGRVLAFAHQEEAPGLIIIEGEYGRWRIERWYPFRGCHVYHVPDPWLPR